MRVPTLIGAIAILSGCASMNPGNSEKYLRPEPATYYSPVIKSPIAGIDLRCVEQRGVTFTDGRGPKDECMYVTADLANFPFPTDKQQRNLAIDYLMSVSDANCTMFMARAFAAKAGWETGRGISKDILTAVASAVTKTAPHSAAVLGLVNLGIGSAVDHVDENYYMKQTFDAMRNAVEVERKQIKSDILQREKQTDYTFPQALSDVTNYDDSCSIARAIASMARITAKENGSQTKALEHAANIRTSEELQSGAPQPAPPDRKP